MSAALTLYLLSSYENLWFLVVGCFVAALFYLAYSFLDFYHYDGKGDACGYFEYKKYNKTLLMSFLFMILSLVVMPTPKNLYLIVGAHSLSNSEIPEKV